MCCTCGVASGYQFRPPSSSNDICQDRVLEYDPRKRSPRTSQIHNSSKRIPSGCLNGTSIEDIPCGMCRQSSATGSHSSSTLLRSNRAGTKPSCSIAADEVDTSFHVVVLVVLLSGLGIQGVSEAQERTAVKALVVAICFYGYCLGACSVCIFEVDVVYFKSIVDEVHCRGGIE